MTALLLAALLAADAAAPATPGAPAAPASLDTVYFTEGGRARGTVVEDDPVGGVTIQLADGTYHRYPRAQVLRVEYAGERTTPPPAAAPPAPPEEPSPPQEAAWPGPGAPASLTFGLGLGAAFAAGSVGSNAGATSQYWSQFVLLPLEAGVRVTPATTLFLLLDIGIGDASGSVMDGCRARGYDCGAYSIRFGAGVRYAFAPSERRTPWISLATAWESTGLGIVPPGAEQENVYYDGWEWLRLGAGYDFRLAHAFGLGGFAGLSFGTYSTLRTAGPTYYFPPDIGAHQVHTWFQLGVRAILFP